MAITVSDRELTETRATSLGETLAIAGQPFAANVLGTRIADITGAYEAFAWGDH